MIFNSYTENTLRYEPEKCINCGTCIEVCPHRVFTEGEKKAHLKAPEKCMECGACMLNCPKNAIYVESGAGCAGGILAGAISKNPKCDCAGHNANFSDDPADENACETGGCCCGK